MHVLNIPSFPPFITRCTLQPLPDFPDIRLLELEYDAAHFNESQFTALNIIAPAHLLRAVKKRRAEYLASRYGLQQALATFGIRQFVVGNDARRAPVWPPGIRGSLSHTHQQVCALLTRRADVLPGVDCERIMTEEVAGETHTMLITEQEKQRLEQCDLPFATALTVAFSVKESLYKALYPRVQQFMDFSAAEIIACSADLQQLSLRMTATFSSDIAAGRVFIGRARLQSDRVTTWVIGSQYAEN